MLTQKKLYLYNKRQLKQAKEHDNSYNDYEKLWISSGLKSIDDSLTPNSYDDLISAIANLVASESNDTTESSIYVSKKINLDQFRVLVQEFAVDGLTEAQIFYAIMPRLTLTAQLPMLRILIDEFGSGNPKRTHSELYKNLLRELYMPTDEAFYYDKTDNLSYAFINMFYWLTLRADDPSYFVGALTYLESIIPAVFPCYIDACQRLGVRHHHYYSEHCHIDTYHAKECFRILKAMHQTDSLDISKAWKGLRLASLVTNQAFEQAVQKSQRLNGLDYILPHTGLAI
jgi:hypothetical protein